ncbi:Zn-dependent peptidase ImmA (M78 family) [Nitrosospira multiformis]|uniref:Zn-dependent peptidase ImmA (M78 family) n=1 Tax=Nitrosospira multiformis TaxID=1231 RepID=A0A2T5I0H6_9PROT|nr:XRE family transcriptional regulator [Nitrosospira multiformis]PTQ77347.1 Zn-dependent peptidase ImmA (M78 family) [Nitrosospira multiformis]
MSHENPFQGAKLRVARLLNGWTKADLAEQLQVSRQFIHALEIGQKPASPDMVAALSLILKVQPSFFNEPLKSEVREEECHFRSRKSMPDKVAEQIISYGTALEIIIHLLEKNLELPVVNFPAIEVNSDIEIEEAATNCRKHWGLGNGPIANMCRVLENAGAIVALYKGDRHEVDALSMARARPLVIRNTLKQSPVRQRFDLAHECGHLVIHQGASTGDKETEDQANRFASAFLMPGEVFSREFPSMPLRLDWQAIYSLKIRWRVSVKAIIRRARDLGLLNSVQYATGNRFLNQTGQSKTEKFDEKIPQEEPELIKTAISAYLDAFSFTPAEFAKQISMTPSMIEQLVGVSALRRSSLATYASRPFKGRR